MVTVTILWLLCLTLHLCKDSGWFEILAGFKPLILAKPWCHNEPSATRNWKESFFDKTFYNPNLSFQPFTQQSWGFTQNQQQQDLACKIQGPLVRKCYLFRVAGTTRCVSQIIDTLIKMFWPASSYNLINIIIYHWAPTDIWLETFTGTCLQIKISFDFINIWIVIVISQAHAFRFRKNNRQNCSDRDLTAFENIYVGMSQGCKWEKESSFAWTRCFQDSLARNASHVGTSRKVNTKN